MPILKFYGDRIEPGVVGSRQVAALPTTRAAQPPIYVNRWATNGKSPSAQLTSMLNEACNQAVLFNSKQVFAAYGPIDAIATASTSDRARWRWAFHSGPMTHALYAVVVMINPNNGIFSLGQNSSSRIDIFDTAGAVVGTSTFDHGPDTHHGAIGLPIRWDDLVIVSKFIDGITPDTDYTALLSERGRVQSACVFELPSMTEHSEGYLSQAITAMTPVLDVFREKPATIGRNLWKRGSAHLMNWFVDNSATGARTTTSATARNVVDNSSTAVSTATPGFTLDLANATRRGQTTVPVVMKVCGRLPDAGGPGGKVYLKDSAGNTVMSIVNQWSGFAADVEWYSTTGTLPATSAKYDLHFASDGVNTFEAHAVSIYPYET